MIAYFVRNQKDIVKKVGIYKTVDRRQRRSATTRCRPAGATASTRSPTATS